MANAFMGGMAGGASVNILINGVDNFSKQFKSAETGLQKLSKGLQVAAVATTGLFALSLKNAMAQERVETKLLALLKNVKTERNANITALKNQANALQRLTGYGDEYILNAQAQLATFQLNSKEIQTLTPRLLDMAAAIEKTTGTSQDLNSISIAVGRALNMGAGALTRYGVVLTDVQKEQFNTATGAEKLALLGEILDQNYKGAAEAVGQTFAGKLNILKASLGDLTESLAIDGGLLDITKQIADALQNVIDKFNALPKEQRDFIMKGAVVGGTAIIGAGVGFKVFDLLKGSQVMPMKTFETNPAAMGAGGGAGSLIGLAAISSFLTKIGTLITSAVGSAAGAVILPAIISQAIIDILPSDEEMNTIAYNAIADKTKISIQGKMNVPFFDGKRVEGMPNIVKEAIMSGTPIPQTQPLTSAIGGDIFGQKSIAPLESSEKQLSEARSFQINVLDGLQPEELNLINTRLESIAVDEETSNALSALMGLETERIKLEDSLAETNGEVSAESIKLGLALTDTKKRMAELASGLGSLFAGGKGGGGAGGGVKITSTGQQLAEGATYTDTKGNTYSWKSGGKSLNDFIMRPGQEPVSFSGDDTVIGMKDTGSLGGNGYIQNRIILNGAEIANQINRMTAQELMAS
jgi:hypothetical protein